VARQRSTSVSPLLALLMLWAVHCPAQDGTLSGQVLRVTGPNEVVVQGPGGTQYQVRLRGTFPGPANHPESVAAQEYMYENLVGRRVTITDVSGGGASVEGTLWYGDQDVNRNVLNDGLLRFDPSSVEGDTIEVYSKSEQEARDTGRGIWAPVDDEGNLPQPTPATPPPDGWKFRPVDADKP